MIGPDAHSLFQGLVERGRRFVLATHMNPDGDAIGSEIGLARYLRAAGAEVRIVNHDPIPRVLDFLEGDGLAIERFEPADHGPLLERADRIVVLDNSAPDRFGRLEAPLLGFKDKVLCIDHHPTRSTPWRDNILDEEAPATAAIVYELLRHRLFRLDPRTAEALYVGLATDTGFFRFNSTTPRAHEIAAELLRAGADPARCYQQVYERNSEEFTRLLGRALAGVRLDADGRVASVFLTGAMIAECRAEDVDPSEITTSLLAMDGVRVALLFRELQGGRVKVSLRSKGEIDVHRLASEFGGGGHRNASGIVAEGRLEEVADRVIRRAAELALAVRAS